MIFVKLILKWLMRLNRLKHFNKRCNLIYRYISICEPPIGLKSPTASYWAVNLCESCCFVLAGCLCSLEACSDIALTNGVTSISLKPQPDDHYNQTIITTRQLLQQLQPDNNYNHHLLACATKLYFVICVV